MMQTTGIEREREREEKRCVYVRHEETFQYVAFQKLYVFNNGHKFNWKNPKISLYGPASGGPPSPRRS